MVLHTREKLGIVENLVLDVQNKFGMITKWY